MWVYESERVRWGTDSEPGFIPMSAVGLLTTSALCMGH